MATRKRKSMKVKRRTKARKTKPMPIGVAKPRNMVDLGLGLPLRIKVAHRYSTTALIDVGTSAFSYNHISCNSLYDPDRTNAGHQPYYFDQIAALYDHYTVIGSRARFCFYQQGQDNANAAHVGVYLNDDTTNTPANIDTYREIAGSKNFKMCPPDNNQVTVIQTRWSGKKAFGKFNTSNKSFTGTAATSPAEEQFYTIVATPVYSGPISLFVTVEVEYIAVWTERKDIAGS